MRTKQENKIQQEPIKTPLDKKILLRERKREKTFSIKPLRE